MKISERLKNPWFWVDAEDSLDIKNLSSGEISLKLL